MTPLQIVLLCIGIVLGLFLIHIALSFYIAYQIYTQTLKRRSKNQWGRAPSDNSPRQLQMDSDGMEWHRANLDKKTDVHIVRDGLNLYGEFYDFGSDRCAMILSGRTESLRYGYYFAQPYAKAGMNILVVDPRAHGFSDGEFNTLGFEESKDDLAWIQYLHENHGINHIVFHGICIGAAGGIFACTSEECPDYVDGIVTEGMFARFGESMRNHLLKRKRMIFPILQCINFWCKHFTGHSMMKGPLNVIDKMDQNLLMLHSLADKISPSHYAQALYDHSGSKEKKLVWFEDSDHSMIRVDHTEEYDREITQFLCRLYSDCQ